METYTLNPKEEPSKAGPIIGIIIILIVLLAGALYFFGQTAKNIEPQLTPEEILNQGASDIENLKVQSNSDSLNSIEQDLIDTDLTNLDKETSAIGTELDNLQ